MVRPRGGTAPRRRLLIQIKADKWLESQTGRLWEDVQ